MAALAVAAGLTVASQPVHRSTALYAASQDRAQNRFSEGTLTLDVQNGDQTAYAPYLVGAMAPGDVVYKSVRVVNTGTLAFRYRATSDPISFSKTGDGAAFAANLQNTTTVVDSSAACGATAFPDGSANLASASFGTVLATPIDFIGQQTATDTSGNRYLAAGASEVLCIRTVLNPAIGDGAQGAEAEFDLHFYADQAQNHAVSADHVLPLTNLIAAWDTGDLYDTLNWTASTGAPVSSYTVQRSSDQGATWATVSTVSGSTTSFVDKTVSTENTYLYRVVANTPDGSAVSSTAFLGTTIPAMSLWTPNGTSTFLPDGSLQLNAAAGGVGDLIYPNSVSSAYIDATFEGYLGDGTGADGMSFFMLDPAKANTKSLGVTGGGDAGFNNAVNVSLDTYANAGDPITATNGTQSFIGMRTNSGDTSGWLSTYVTPTSIRNAWHTYRVVVDHGTVTVWLDGTQVLTNSTMPIPSTVLFGFGASTGGQTDAHLIRNLSIKFTP